MGNILNKNTGSHVDRDNKPQPESHAPEKHQPGNPSDGQKIVPSEAEPSKAESSINSGFDDPPSSVRNGQLRKNAGDMCDNCYRIHQKAAGKAVDPRLLTVLEYFRQLYVRQEDVFKTSFPDLHPEIDELFKKHGAVLSQAKYSRTKVRTVQRSLSAGSSREISGDDLKLERFKVKTLDLGGGVKQGGKGGLDDKTKGGAAK